MNRRLLTLIAALLGATAVIAINPTGIGPEPAVVDAAEESDYAGRCQNADHHGVFSNTSNQQRCTIGAWVCATRNTPNWPGAGTHIDTLPFNNGITTVGVIMQPWDVNWHETDGNYGYVQNVCNGTAGSYNLHTLVPFTNQGGPQDPSGIPNVDARTLHFADQLRMIQKMCAGNCHTEFISYRVELLLTDDNPQHLYLKDTNHISRDSWEYMALSQYLEWDRITLDFNSPWLTGSTWVKRNSQGMDMGANGWQTGMINTVRVGPHPNWWEAPPALSPDEEYTKKVGKLVIRMAILFFL